MYINLMTPFFIRNGMGSTIYVAVGEMAARCLPSVLRLLLQLRSLQTNYTKL